MNTFDQLPAATQTRIVADYRDCNDYGRVQLAVTAWQAEEFFRSLDVDTLHTYWVGCPRCGAGTSCHALDCGV